MIPNSSVEAPERHAVRSAFAAGGMFVILLLSYAINAMDRQIYPLLAPDVRREFGFTLAETGLLATIFTLGMAAAGLPTAYLLKHVSRKATTMTGIAVFSIATVLTATGRVFGDMLVYRAITGLGEAMQLTVIIAIGTSFFERKRSMAVGAVNVAFGLGALFGPVIAGDLLAAHRGWRFILVAFGLSGFAAIACIAGFVRTWFSETRSALPVGNASREIHGGADTLLNRNTVLLTVLSVIAGMIIYGFLGMYPTLLREQLGFSPAAAGRIVGAYGIGVFLSLVGGWLGDRFDARAVLCVSFLAAALLGYGLFYAARSQSAHSALAFGWGFVVSGTVYVNLAGYHIRSVSSRLNSTASGIFVSSLYSSAALAGFTIGWLATHAGWATAGLVQISALAAAAAMLSLALDPSHMGQHRENTVLD